MNPEPAGFSLTEIAERGSLWRRGRHVALNDYQPLNSPTLQDQSLDLVTCIIGLHHCRPELLDGFIDSIVKLIRPGGLFILRDHDVPTVEKRTFVSLAHMVVNAGGGVSWEENLQETRYFAPLSFWTQYLESRGLQDTGLLMQQMDDPTDNMLMAFVKPQL